MDAKEFSRARQLPREFARYLSRCANMASSVGAATRPAGESLRLALARAVGTVLEQAPESLSRQRLEEIRSRLVCRIARERGWARCGNRSYDVNRHIALHQCLGALAAILKETENAARNTKKPARTPAFGVDRQ